MLLAFVVFVLGVFAPIDPPIRVLVLVGSFLFAGACMYYLLFLHVKEMAVGPENVTVSTLLHTKRYAWSDIEEVLLEDRRGKGRDDFITYHFLVIKTPGQAIYHPPLGPHAIVH